MATIAAARGRQAALDVIFHRLDDHDGVIDHNADRQHQTEQRKIVQAETRHRHGGECADNRHGHGNQRNDRRPPTLQEYEHDDRHQNDRVAQRLEHLVDRFANEGGRIVANCIGDAVGKIARKLHHFCLHPIGGIQCVGIGQLKHGQAHRGIAIETAGDIVAAGPHFHVADILNANHPAIGQRAHHNVFEFIRVQQSPLDRERNLLHLPIDSRRLADLTQRHIHVLLTDGGDHVGHR